MLDAFTIYESFLSKNTASYYVMCVTLIELPFENCNCDKHRLYKDCVQSSTRLFADDCILYRRIRNDKNAEILHEDLNQLAEWEKKWGMAFHPDKCIVGDPAIPLIKWLRPKGLKVCSYVGKYAEFKNQTLKKLAGTQKCYARRNTPGGGGGGGGGGRQFLKLALKWGTLYHRI